MVVEFGPTPLTERQTLLVILRATGPAGAAAGTGRGCCRAHPRARTGRAAPSRTALRSVGARGHVLVPGGGARAPRRGGQAPRGRPGSTFRSGGMSSLAPTLEAFFTQRLVNQRRCSPKTVASYRDAWRLLVGFAHRELSKAPS